MKLNSERSQEMHITNDGKLLVVVGVTTKVSFIDFAKLAEVATITEKENIISSFLSADEKFLLLNTSYKTPELHLWSIKIGGGANCELINRFIGFKQSQFSLRCCLGWREEQMIAQGSEDGSVYIWHRNHSKPLKILRRSNKRYYNNNNNKSNI
jgi:WD40 repeat protein